MDIYHFIGESICIVGGVAIFSVLATLALERIINLFNTAAVITDAIHWRRAVKKGKLQEPRVLTKKSDVK